MTLQELKERLPDFARDLKLNLGSLASEPVLTEQQRWGTFVASAIASRNDELTRAVLEEARGRLEPAALTAARTAAAVMGMTNVYYRFVHLAEKDDYRSLPARLRMNALANPGVAKQDFELWSLAVSAINGCGMCIGAHEKVLREAGMTAEQVQAAVRIASTVHAVAVVLDAQKAEQALALAA